MAERENPAAAPEAAATDTSIQHHKPIEIWVIGKQTPGWLFAAARVLRRWPAGKELSEEEFEAGIKAARDLVLR